MDEDTKKFAGKLLGELHRLQRRTDPRMPGISDATLYGLLNGFEAVIDEALERVGWVSSEQLDATSRVLNLHWSDTAKLAAFKGFYDIEHELQAVGVDRLTALRCITYLAADGKFAELIAKMDSSHSPSECRRFRLGDWDK